MQIDENTGLVQVPEDMFWRITSKNFYDETLYELHLIRKYTWDTKKPRPFWLSKTVTTWYEEIAMQKSLYSRIVQDAKKEVPEGYKIIETYSGTGNDGRSENLILKNIEASPTVFFHKSVKAWNEYIESQHLQGLKEDARIDREKEAQKYTGDYPPRKLEK